MAAYDDTIIVGMNVTDGLFDKLKADERLKAHDRGRVSAIQAKVDASEDLSRREIGELTRIIRESLSKIA